MEAVAFDIDYNFEEAGCRYTEGNADAGMETAALKDAFGQAAGGDYDAAALLFENAGSRGGTSAFDGYFHAGLCRLKRNDACSAVRSFENALKIDAENQLLRLYCGIAYHMLGLFADANLHWWAALKIEENSVSRAFLNRFFMDDVHPERLALYPICNGKGIDVGCGFRKTHPGAIGIDLTPGGQKGRAGCVKGQQSVADIAASGDALDMIADASLDYVVQRHNLEHYQDPVKALQEWKRVLKHGGLLGMVVPDDAVCDTIRLDKTPQARVHPGQHGTPAVSHRRIPHRSHGAALAQMVFCPALPRGNQRPSRWPVGDLFDYAECLRRFKAGMLARQSRQYRLNNRNDLAQACDRMITVMERNG